MQRSIVHLDADAFFASVEQAADARLRGRPVAVGGEKRGIIASASYEARRFGIYTPMPTALARRLCPKLILLPGDFEKYELFSRLMFSYAYDFTPDVEIGSIDEGYFDLTSARKPAVDIADTIRRAIRQSLNLSVSEGIGSSKLISQIGSKLKKPSAFLWVPPGTEGEFLEPLENHWLPGVGPKTAAQLTSAGLARIGQVARTPVELLGLLVGNQAPQLRKFARGIDERPVVPARAPAKSYGEQETFPADTTDEAFLEATLRRMADRLMAKVRADGKSIRTVTVKVRYNDMDEQQAAESLSEPTDLENEVYSTVSQLFRKAWQRRVSLRLVSLRLSNVYEGVFRGELELDVPSRQHEALERLARRVDELRKKFGHAALLRGHDFLLRDRRGRGEEPGPPDRGPLAPPAEDRPRGPRGATVPGFRLGETITPYRAAVVQRQRLGNAIAMKHGRETAPPNLPTGPSAAARFPDRPPRIARPARVRWTPLNVHSYYSFLDSTLSVENIVQWAVRHEVPAIALTDTNNLHGAVAFAQAAAAAGIKPILGAELPRFGLRVYVENVTGYGNLCRWLSEPTSAAAPHPPADTTGLIAAGSSPAWADLFPGRFYLDAPVKGSPLPRLAAFPIRYEHPDDRWKFDIVQSIRTLTLLRQQHPEKRAGGEFHFRAPGEVARMFGEDPRAVALTNEIAERCNFSFTLGVPQFPPYAPADGSSPAEFLHRLVMEGLRRRYPREHARYRAQLEEELAIITDVHYEEYFLVMWDILRECRRRGIDWITRGSAADSLACYCLGISGVCPVRFDLYFRRFLNKDRMALNKLPDIDVDFPHDRKDDVIDLIFEKYGPEHTAVVGGFSTIQARSAFAEVAKVLGVSEYQVRRITERLPHFTRPGELETAIRESRECAELPLDQEPYAGALRMAVFLDTFPRYPKMHPCGLVLSRQPMTEITPCFRSAKGYPTTHFDMDSVEAVGLIKMDILAQGGLAVMRDVKTMLASSPGPAPADSACAAPAPPAPPSAPAKEPFELDALEPWQDAQVWDLISSGGARAVHHIESPAMISLCKMCNVRDIDTLIAIVSVIRPGAANESHKMEFARRYQGLSPVRYAHPSLEACTRSTFGLVVYEEHILQICDAFAGLPPGRADVLRRALGKEKQAVVDEIHGEFIACARRHGRSETEIAEVWKLVSGFRGYAFCKAHSTAYGVEAYQSAWLKLNFPAEFMAAVLSNGKGFYSPLVYILECHRLGIPLLPPCVNDPGPAFSVHRGRIRVPALNVKGLTRRTTDRMVRERACRPFSSLADFMLRVAPLPEEMEPLIRVGAFDGFGQDRTAQYWDYRSLLQSDAYASARRPRRSDPAGANSGDTTGTPAATQLWLLPPGGLEQLPSVPLSNPDRLQRLRWEDELLGYPVSGHPLELYPDIAWTTYCPVNQLHRYLRQEIVTCGLVIEQRMYHQVTGEPMKFITIADWTGIVETELFARTYRSYGLNTVRYRVLEVTATVEPFENGRGFTLRVHRAGPARKAGPR